MFFGFFYFFIINFQLLKGLLQKMLNYRLGTVNEKHWGCYTTLSFVLENESGTLNFLFVLL